jgi:hypothetical protein
MLYQGALIMSVFNAQHITATRSPVSSVCKDREVPITNGVADGSRIGTSSFLSGITAGVADNINDGIDQTIINGDQVEEIKGKRATKIKEDCETHILGSLKILVDGKEEREVRSGRITHIGNTGIAMACAQVGLDTIRIQGDRYVMITGNYTRNIMGSLFKTTVAGEVDNEVSDIAKFFGQLRYEYGGYDAKTCWFGAVTALPINTDIRGVNMDFTIGTVGLSLGRTKGFGIQAQLVGGDGKLGFVKLISGGVCNKMDLLGT